MREFRVVAALVGGVLAAAVLYQIGAALALLLTVGIPLGSSGDVPPSYFVLNLGVSLGAAWLGGIVVRRVARVPGWRPSAVLALLIAIAALWGFSRHEGGWPTWYPPVLALVAFVGVLAPLYRTRVSRGRA